MSDSTKKTAKGNIITCGSCGAQFDEMLPECPYCGSASIKGAQAEYMEQLEIVRSDMEALGNVPLEETKKELKKQSRFAFKVLVVIAVVVGLLFGGSYFVFRDEDRDHKKDYAWQLETFPVWNELYEQEKYEELVALYEKAWEDGAPVYDWEHWNFCSELRGFMHVEAIWAKEEAGEELTHWEYEDLLYYGFKAKGLAQNTGMTKEEMQKLEPYIQKILADLESRWSFTEKEQAAFEEEVRENYGVVSFKSCEKYVESWLERRTKE